MKEHGTDCLDEKQDKPKNEKLLREPKHFVCIEGETHPWADNTITTEEIIEAGGWDPDQGVIEVDRDQNERTLRPGEVIEIKPGKRFGKRVCWKRG